MSPHDSEVPTRIRLLEAAILLFAEKGFDAVGIREIAQLAKANSALVQYHFGGKSGLYVEALHYLFTRKPVRVPQPPASADEPGARQKAVQAMHGMVLAMLTDMLECSKGEPLELAAHLLVTRELQAPRPEVLQLILVHMQPYVDHMLAVLNILLPGLERRQAMDHMNAIYAQVLHIHMHLPIIRILREEPDYPSDLDQVARQITAFSLRGLGVTDVLEGV